MALSAKRVVLYAQALDDIAARLRIEGGYDPEQAHGDADNVLLDALDQAAPEIAHAYRSLAYGAPWWATA